MSDGTILLVIFLALVVVILTFRRALRRAPRLTEDEINGAKDRQARFDEDKHKTPSGEQVP